MEIWEKLRDNISKTYHESKKQAALFKDHVNDEWLVNRIKKKLQAVKDDESTIFKVMGKRVFQKMNANEALNRELFQSDFEYLISLKKRIADLEGEINQVYEEAKTRKMREDQKKNDEEIIIDTKKPVE